MKKFFTQPVGQLARQTVLDLLVVIYTLLVMDSVYMRVQKGSIEYSTLLGHLHF